MDLTVRSKGLNEHSWWNRVNKIPTKELKQLKSLLLKKDLNKLIVDSYLEVAVKKLGYKNIDELKKT